MAGSQVRCAEVVVTVGSRATVDRDDGDTNTDVRAEQVTQEKLVEQETQEEHIEQASTHVAYDDIEVEDLGGRH